MRWNHRRGDVVALAPRRPLVSEFRRRLGIVDARTLPGFAAVLASKHVDMRFAEAWVQWRWLPDEAGVAFVAAYTDGAAVLDTVGRSASSSAGWGVVFIATVFLHEDVLTGILGMLFGPVVTQAGDVGYCGASHISAPVAELTAMTVALALPNGAPRGECTPMIIFSDSLYTVETVSCRQRALANADTIQQLRRLWWRVADHTQLRHIRAHAGHLGNELADTRAELGRFDA